MAKQSCTFFLAANLATENEQNAITSLKVTHAVTVVPRDMLSIEGTLTGAEFVAAMKRQNIRIEASNFLCRLFDSVEA